MENDFSSINTLGANLHTHTTRCGHAFGADREYVEAAIKAGFKTLGFSDHTPMPFKGSYYSSFRMRIDAFDDYFESICALRDEYASQIQILIGVEAEFYEELFDDLRDLLSTHPIDYAILGQHFIGREDIPQCRFYPGDAHTDPKILANYYNCVLRGLETGFFTYLAHPDVINFVGDADEYTTQTIAFLERVKALGYPLEINRLGAATNRHYPRERFWQLVGQVGCNALIGIDAHEPGSLLDAPGLQKCLDIARRNNLVLVNNDIANSIKRRSK